MPIRFRPLEHGLTTALAMVTRLVFTSALRARPPACRFASSLRNPRQRRGPLAGSFCSASSTTPLYLTPRHVLHATTVTQTSRGAQSTTQTMPTAVPPATDVENQPSSASDADASKGTGADAQPNADSTTDSTSSKNNGSTSHAGDGKADSSDRNGSTSGGGGRGGGGSRGPLTWGAVGLLGIVGALVVGYYRMKWDEKQNRVSSEVTSTGKPALGGPFTLVDMHGRPVTDRDFHGSFVLLYFGFCHCPDICPSELVKVGAIADKLEGRVGRGVVKPVFVSVDPDRDSLAQLKHYAQDFHPSIEYLTGTKDQVAKAAKAYRVYFSKTEEHDEDEDYLVDHSIVIYLLAPDGDFLDFFTQRTTIADCVDRTSKQIKEFRALAS